MRRGVRIQVVLGLFLLAIPGCARERKDASGDGEAGTPTLYVRSELSVPETGARADQYFRLSSNQGTRLAFTASQIRMFQTQHPVQMPPLFADPPKKTVEFAEPSAAAWKSAVDGLVLSPNEREAWATLLRSTGASLSGAALRGRWKQLSKKLSISAGSAKGIVATKTHTGVMIAGKVAVTIPADASFDDDNPPPMVGQIRLRVEIDPTKALATRGWLLLDARSPDRPAPAGSGGPSRPGEFVSLALAWCFDPNGSPSYEATCFPPDTPTFALKRGRQVAKTYLGAACEPRIAELMRAMTAQPFEASLEDANYPLVRSIGGRALQRGGLLLDVVKGRLVSSEYRGLAVKVLPAVRRMKALGGETRMRLLIRLPRNDRIAGPIQELARLTKPAEQLELVVEDPRPRTMPFVPDTAVPWVKTLVATIAAEPSVLKRVEGLSRLSGSIGICKPLIAMFGDLAGAAAGSRETMLIARLPAALRACKCEGVDMDGLDAMFRFMAIGDPRRRYRTLTLPLTTRPGVPAIRFPATTTGQAFVDRISKLSASERKGFRVVFAGGS